MKAFKTLLSCKSVRLRLVQLTLRPVIALTTAVVHEQGEMDVDEGQPEGGLVVVAGIDVVVDVGRLVDVDVALLLVEEIFVVEEVGGRLVVVVGGTGFAVDVVPTEVVDGRPVDVVVGPTVLDEVVDGRLLDVVEVTGLVV